MKIPALTMLLLAASATAAGVYTWTDPASGKTVYSDQPPPASIKAQQKNLQGNSIETSGPGYSLKEAMKKAPVTLFATECGMACEVWDGLRLERERCGSLLAVSHGSDRPPRLVILEYHGGKSELPTALVDITTYSETGYVGQDPSTILTRLLHTADENPMLASVVAE